jgi:signal transduction histidine kinase
VLQSEGLGAAFNWLANQMSRLYDLQVDLDMSQDYQLASEDLRVLIFQLVRELLFNVVKHAQVNHAQVVMHLDGDQFVVRVEDKGIGFDPSVLQDGERPDIGGFGLYSIRERLGLFGGEVTITSQPGRGTQVMLSLPQSLALNDLVLE